MATKTKTTKKAKKAKTAKIAKTAKKAPRAAKPKKAATATTGAGKTTAIDKVLPMLKAKAGATVAEIAKTMGWLPHTTRAFIAVNNKKHGWKMSRTKDGERGSVYRVEA